MTEKSEESLRQHRQEVRRAIVWPVMGGVFILAIISIAVLAGAATGRISGQQVNVAACLSTCCLFLPMFLILLVLDYIALLIMLGSGSLYNVIRPVIHALNVSTEQGKQLTRQTAEKITDPIINTRTRVARWRHAILATIANDSITNNSEVESDR